jgi:hypothetical protein
MGVINHEIGTHFLRKYNEKIQGYNTSQFRRKHELKSYIATEEGLASINQLYDTVFFNLVEFV